jgi:hypothetical protein
MKVTPLRSATIRGGGTVPSSDSSAWLRRSLTAWSIAPCTVTTRTPSTTSGLTENRPGRSSFWMLLTSARLRLGLPPQGVP